MALNDSRVFRHEKEWWVATVLGRGGIVVGDEERNWSESVYFQRVSDEEKRLVRAELRSARLNALSHAAVVALLQRAEPTDVRMTLQVTNAPQPQGFESMQLVDRECLTWMWRLVRVHRVLQDGDIITVDGIEFACLDDSALHDIVQVESGSVVEYLLNKEGIGGPLRVVDAIKSGFADLPERE